MLTEKKISVVVACYNDAGSVHEMHRRVTEAMKKITANFEIVYVNDASPDNAIQVLREVAAKDKRLVVVEMSRNFGADIAYSAGLSVCTGDAAILIDGDIQDPPELFPEMVSKWLEGYEIVYGQRRKRKENVIKRFFYKVFYRLLRSLSYIKMPLDAGNFGLIDRKVIAALNSMPETDRFLRGLRAWVGYRSTGVPYDRSARFSGKSASGLSIYIREARRGIFSFSNIPLELISYLAATMFFLSIVAIIVYITLALFSPDTPRGFLTLLVVMLILFSIQFICLGVLAEYVGSTFKESKRRPKFIIQEVINDPRK